MDKKFFRNKVEEIEILINGSSEERKFTSELIVERSFNLNPYVSIEEILNWYSKIKKNNALSLKEINLIDCQKWNIGDEKISHESNSFFEIIGLEIKNSHSREIGNRGWYQPILKEVGFDGGILGLIRKKISGIPHYLVNAKAEPGNYNEIQISPTLQATNSNLKAAHGGSRPRYYDYFVEFENDHNVLLNQWLPEDGGRFYLKRNKGIVINLPENQKVDLYEDYLWITLNQIVQLIKNHNIINPHLRSLISII